nr:hypothetical protein B0A51_17006 [Rachicladosporium sp. CCFEE 5018]
MSEFIGSRISLISESDIKYIGTLHEINSENSTVALENVTSHGTQGRKGNPAEEIAGSDQIYEYIVFRGSDVKELQIVEAPQAQENQRPVPNDPAIMGSTRPPGMQQQPPQSFQQAPPQQFRQQPPPQQPYGYPPGPPPNQFQQQPRFQGPGGPHGFPGSPGAVPGYGMPYGGPPGYGPPPPGYGPPPGHDFPQHPQGFPPPQQNMPPQSQNQQRPPTASAQAPGMNGSGSGSKQGTPQPPAKPANQPPPPQQPLQSQAKQAPSAKPAANAAKPGPPPPVESKPSAAAATAPSAASQATPPAPQIAKKPQNTRVAVPRPSPNSAAQSIVPPAAPPAQAPPAQPQSYVDATSAATAAVAAAMAKLGQSSNNTSQSRPAQHTAPSNGLDNLTQQVDRMRVQDRGRGGRAPRGSRGGVPRGGARGVEVPKEDYDFASANAKFNKTDVVKEAIASGSPITSPHGESADPLSANGVGNGVTQESDDVVIPAKEIKGYDKKTSFFDNISSDLKEREAGRGGFDGRAMRTQERSRNLETFGAVGVDGGYRGRGRGRGTGYRGGRGRGAEGRGGPERGFGINGRGGPGRGQQAGEAGVA